MRVLVQLRSSVARSVLWRSSYAEVDASTIMIPRGRLANQHMSDKMIGRPCTCGHRVEPCVTLAILGARSLTGTEYPPGTSGGELRGGNGMASCAGILRLVRGRHHARQRGSVTKTMKSSLILFHGSEMWNTLVDDSARRLLLVHECAIILNTSSLRPRHS